MVTIRTNQEVSNAHEAAVTAAMAQAEVDAGRAVRSFLAALAMLHPPTAVAGRAESTPVDRRGLTVAIPCSLSTLNRWVREGLEPDSFVGNRPRYDVARVRAWVAARGRKAAATKADVDSADVSKLLQRGGLRAVGGR